VADPESQPPKTLDYATPQKRELTGRKFTAAILIAGLLFCGIVIAILLPGVNRPHISTNRGRCLSNLHQIGLGILLYNQDYKGAFPDSLITLAANEQLAPSVFICPSSNDTPATSSAGMSTPGHLSFIYLGKGLTDKTVLPNQVIAYEPLANHGDGIDVLFGDGHAEFIDAKRATKIIADANAGKHPVMVPP
jgi:prepilin-type processing-associated H-X9-DG protein